MKLGQAVQPEHILRYLTVGVAILDTTSLRILYINPYLHSLLEKPWNERDIVGLSIQDILPKETYALVFPLLQRVVATGEGIHLPEVPYEGYLEERGRTYWEIGIERPAPSSTQAQEQENTLLITVKDVTDTVRSRLHLKAIRRISSAIAGAYALPRVLDRILQAVQEMIGASSTRCAILLIEHSVSGIDERNPMYEELPKVVSDLPQTVTVAAHKGLHLSSHDWHPLVSEQILLGRAAKEGHTLIITDTKNIPRVALPWLDDQGVAKRPGSVLCVPIYEPQPPTDDNDIPSAMGQSASVQTMKRAILGTIEVYHRRPRGFPPGEVQLLEQFAQQAGLAIDNARLFRRIDKWARLASRNAHQRKNVMLAIPDGVIICDPRWRVAEVNHAASKLFGWSEDILGTPILQAMAQSTAKFQHSIMEHPDPIPELEQRAEQGQIDEFKIVGADKVANTMRCSYTPIRDTLGDTFAYIVIYHDITKEVAARERVEAKVKARTAELDQRNQALQLAQATQEMERARLELLLERLPSGVMLVNAEDNLITIINQRAVQLLQRMGAPLQQFDDLVEVMKHTIGEDSEALFSQIAVYGTAGSVVPYEERPLHVALSKGEATEAELHMQGTDGQTLYLLVSGAPVRGIDGSIISAILVLHEITNLKALERAREDFFTTMAHELKTPLANIRAHLSALLARDLEWSFEEQQDFLQTADGQVERLVGMINHVLDASRVEAGALRLQLEPVLLPEMLEDVEERLEALIASSNRRLQITLPPHVPAVQADYELIISVLINLLSNAFRYAPEGDVVQLAIELQYEQHEQHPTRVLLQVIDRGPGLTQEQQMELFTRFSTFAAMHRPAIDRPGQPALERRRGSGRWSPATGLGLYISRGIIEAHGSQLTLKSSPGQGANFAFTLPVVESKYDTDAVAHQ